MDEESELERLDPESEDCFAALTDRIAEELAARISVGDDPGRLEDRRALSELIADAILDVFVVRLRTSPRYRWRKPR